MTTPVALAWIKPWMVVLTLTLVAAAGATAVYYTGESQHRRDRADIVRWERDALPAALDAERIEQSLRGEVRKGEPRLLLVALQHDQHTVATPPIPEIMRPAAAAYLDAVEKTQDSLQAYGTPSFERLQALAEAGFAAAKAALQTVLCRARLPACSSP
ncbi:MAG TPA: hypothetical protein VGW79_03925 [Actinomycetota bacterium]|nr:hypothetical protein [Actinomycetota bacterium]